MTDLDRAHRAIAALRTPDASLARVPNTVRQSIAEVIEDLLAALPKGEPVAWRWKFKGEDWWFMSSNPNDAFVARGDRAIEIVEPLYLAAPPAGDER
jgi:hypothetical protein